MPKPLDEATKFLTELGIDQMISPSSFQALLKQAEALAPTLTSQLVGDKNGEKITRYLESSNAFQVAASNILSSDSGHDIKAAVGKARSGTGNA